jgi:hypothetical protein
VTARPRLLLLGASAGLVLLSGGIASAALPTDPSIPSTPSTPTVTAPTTVTLGTAAESWYQLTRINTCNSPVGCLPASIPALPALPDLPVDPTVFPADTLHVGWAAGIELARSYLALDTSALPKGAKLISGELTVPLLADPTQGTLLADGAGVKACLVTTSITDGVAGSLSAAPGLDCSVSSPLNAEGSSYTVDLQPMIDAWNSGTPNEGLALTPFESSSVTSAWAIALPGRNAAGLPHIEAKLQYVVANAAVPPTVVPPAAPAAVTQPVQAPVQQVIQPAAQPVVQAPVAVRKPTETLLAAGVSPLGWAVMVLGICAVLGLGFVATAPAEQQLS